MDGFFIVFGAKAIDINIIDCNEIDTCTACYRQFWPSSQITGVKLGFPKHQWYMESGNANNSYGSGRSW